MSRSARRLSRPGASMALILLLIACSGTDEAVSPPPRTADEAALNLLFDGATEPPYSPEDGYAHDTRRVLDVVAIQGSLLEFNEAEGRYPESLPELLPNYPPAGNQSGTASLPTDPETGSQYEYWAIDDGLDYVLLTRLSNNKFFSGIAHETP